MVDTTISINYIVKTPGMLGGRARIAGRRIGVSDIVNAHLRLGAPVEEVVEAYEITPAQVYAALAYYYDHQDEIDTHLEAEAQAFADLPANPRDLALLARLKERDPERYERLKNPGNSAGE